MTGCKAACPWCEVDVWWESETEHTRHVRMCERIEKGRLVEEISSIQVEFPEVPKKPSGWKWT